MDLKCRSCFRPIRFVSMAKSGKSMPVEKELVDMDDMPPGTVLITNNGQIHTKPMVGVSPNVRGSLSHFAVCPGAKEHRKPR